MRLQDITAADCGKVVDLECGNARGGRYKISVKIAAIIIGPRGRLVLYEPEWKADEKEQRALSRKQHKAIVGFMKEQKHG